ncbi:MAG: hypothetical protein HOI53_00090 [Francisellaceae bacterium]|jgi:hypothetical protein|nr:hypothetical protein [Francisellaceae bacterium]MBT6206398.1 hypothetical protein [Francisellaceae bacterium]MBT6537954.1 hypothetical protein [Francisellaceae bacterium]
MANEHVREIVIDKATTRMPVAARKELNDKYIDMYNISRSMPLGFDFPDRGTLFYGIMSIKNHFKNYIKYPKRRGQSTFVSVCILLSAMAFFYGTMFGLPAINHSFKDLLSNSLMLREHKLLLWAMGTGTTLVGGSIGQYVFGGLYSIYSKFRYGVDDPGISEIKELDLKEINKHIPLILNEVGRNEKIQLTLDEANNIRKKMMEISEISNVSHVQAAVDFINGDIDKAFRHPRSGPLLMRLCIPNTQRLVTALQQFNFIRYAEFTASMELAKQIRTGAYVSDSVLPSQLELGYRGKIDELKNRVKELEGKRNISYHSKDNSNVLTIGLETVTGIEISRLDGISSRINADNRTMTGWVPTSSFLAAAYGERYMHTPMVDNYVNGKPRSRHGSKKSLSPYLDMA